MKKLNYNELNEKSLELEAKLAYRTIGVDHAKGDNLTLGDVLDINIFMSDAQKEFLSKPIDPKYYVWSTPKTSYNWTWEIFKEFNMKGPKYKYTPIESA